MSECVAIFGSNQFALLDEMLHFSVREVANPSLDVAEYCAILSAWKESYPEWPGFPFFLERQHLASSLRSVHPVGFARVAGLLDLLLERGASNCVLYSSKWELAVSHWIAADSSLQGSG